MKIASLCCVLMILNMLLISNANARRVAYCKKVQDSTPENGKATDFDFVLVYHDKGPDPSKAPTRIPVEVGPFEREGECQKALRNLPSDEQGFH